MRQKPKWLRGIAGVYGEISSLEETMFFMSSLKILRKIIVKKEPSRDDGVHLQSQNLGGRGLRI